MGRELKIEYLATEKLIPYLNNARTHTDKQILQIAASIREFGFTNPILVDRLNTIIAGHCRLSAAKLLEMETVPVLRIEHMTKAQQKAYVLADNQLATISGWDRDLLKLELADLKDMDFDLDLLGFGDIKGLEFEPDLPDDENKDAEQKMVITVTCENQSDLEDLFSELNSRGFKVKI